jgi:acetyl esterase/lipase
MKVQLNSGIYSKRKRSHLSFHKLVILSAIGKAAALWAIALLFLNSCSDRPPTVKVLKNLEYSSYPLENGKGKLLLDLYLPQLQSSQPLPAIVFIHGGGWLEDSKESCPGQLLAQRGFAIACINYRYSTQAIFPAQILDVKKAVRWLRENAAQYNLDPNRFGALGNSAGGHLSVLLATSAGASRLEPDSEYATRIQAAGTLYGPTDLTKFPPAFAEYPTPEVLSKNQDKPWWRLTYAAYKLLGAPVSQRLELANLANPSAHIDSRDPPVLIVHGELDDIVPISQSDLLFEALKAKGVEVEYIRDPNLKHSYRGKKGEPFEPKLLDATIKFFDRHLKK